MGAGRWDANSRSAYRSFADSTHGRRTEEIYRSQALHSDLDPKSIKVRESRDSTENPNSTPIIVAIDVTGSMGILADHLARKGLGQLFESLIDHSPVSDPHVMFMAVGDARCDRAPLQVSQFEADKRIIEQLTQIYIEHGGGGNAGESYDLAWYFSALHTAHDAMEVRGRKGYIFTVGDEPAPPGLTPDQIRRFIGDSPERPISAAELLALAQRVYHVYHIVIEEGGGFRQYSNTMSSWAQLIGEHAIPLSDYTKLTETIVTAIAVAEGESYENAAARWKDMGTARVVERAVKQLPPHGGAVATT